MAGANDRSAVPNLSSDANEIPQVPKGLRVLVADDDVVCLAIVRATLLQAGYIVTICTGGPQALSILRERKGAFDIVLLDVHMPQVSGLQVLEKIGQEMDIPAVLISSDRTVATVIEGIKLGACGHLLKPFQKEQLEMIWQHVIRKRFASMDKNKRNGNNVEESTSDPNKKKERAKWSNQMHQQFIKAVKILGIDKAAPKKILELMDLPTLTRHQVASHLQKFRIYLKHNGHLALQEFNSIPDEVLLGMRDSAVPSFGRNNLVLGNNPSSVTQNPTLWDHVPDFGTYQISMPTTNTLSVQAQHMNVQSAAVERAAAETYRIESPECVMSGEDEILREDYLQAFFNSNNDDAFMDILKDF